MTVLWSGKDITALSDAVLQIAAQDVANCTAKLGGTPPPAKADYLARLNVMAAAISAEKTKRGLT